jgi:hypothetical protein
MSRIYDELNADGSIKNTLDIFINSIIPWGYKGVYNNSTGYIMNNSVLYNGTTYICIAPISVGHLPTETNFWRPLSSGLFFKGDYDGNTQYYERDIVYYNSTKALYICLSKPSINTIPTNTTYWQLLFQFTEFDYDANIPSLFVAIDNSITIAHNLNSYPLPHVVSTTGSSYGHGGFGLFGYGGSTNAYQVFSRAEYPDMNTIKLYLEETYTGTATITTISSTEYNIAFSDGTIKLILK